MTDTDVDHLIESQVAYFVSQWQPSMIQEPEYLGMTTARQEWVKTISYQAYLLGIDLVRRGVGLTT